MKSNRFLLPILAALLLFLPRIISAQTEAELNYTGQVTAEESGESLIGVNILILRTGSGVQTDFDGYFELTARPGDSIRLSYIGYETIEFQLGLDTELHFNMVSANQMLEEIIVVGYGTQRQR